MKCPVCARYSLHKQQLEAGLPAHRCNTCHGIWISASKYWEWLKEREDTVDVRQSPMLPLPIEETARVKLCAECGHILRRYQVWPNERFYLDRCETCESMWLDKDEWEYLKSKGEHDQVREFFSRDWQEQVREEEAREWMKSLYVERFGDADYTRIREIREWLWQHPRQAMLIAYLTDRDPYKPVS